jgi:hypothetical protein
MWRFPARAAEAMELQQLQVEGALAPGGVIVGLGCIAALYHHASTSSAPRFLKRQCDPTLGNLRDSGRSAAAGLAAAPLRPGPARGG